MVVEAVVKPQSVFDRLEGVTPCLRFDRALCGTATVGEAVWVPQSNGHRDRRRAIDDMITSTANPRVIEARKLVQRKHRIHADRFMVEGLQLLLMAAEQHGVPEWAGKIRPCELFYCRERLRGGLADALIEAYADAGAEPLAVSETVIDAISRREASQGAAATLVRSPLEWTLAEIKKRAAESAAPKLILVLDRPQNPGNVGTLIRTADAVGALAVVMLEPCVDPFDPKTIRSSMGSIFSIPVARLRDPNVLSSWLSEIGWCLVGADGAADRVVWNSDALDGSVALALGSEADGFSDAVRGKLDRTIGLPLQGHAESLNMAVAGGVLMYEWLRLHRVEVDARSPVPPPGDPWEQG